MVSHLLRFEVEFADPNIGNIARDRHLEELARGALRSNHCKLSPVCSTLVSATPKRVANPHRPSCSLQQLSHELMLPEISD